MQADFPEIVLASASSARAGILANAGLRFHQRASGLDETEQHARFGKTLSPPDLAMHLARQKADLVAAMEPNAIVIGADQVLALGTEVLQKPATPEDARAQLARLRGKVHQLHSAISILRDGQATGFCQSATLTMRDFSDEFLDWYLDTAGDGVLTSVGAYHLEGLGIHLFSKIEGDYFTVLGLPIEPVLAELRRVDVLMT